MIMAMGIERDLIGHPWAEQSDEGGVAHHGGCVALAANMPIEADDMIGRRHDDVKVVTDQQDGRAEFRSHTGDQLVERGLAGDVDPGKRFIEHQQFRAS